MPYAAGVSAGLDSAVGAAALDASAPSVFFIGDFFGKALIFLAVMTFCVTR